MIETEAYVVQSAAADGSPSNDNDWVLVEAARRSACDSCGVKSGCGTSVFSKVLGKKPTQILARNEAGAEAGDKVVVGIDEFAYLRGSLMIYGVPLLTAVLAAIGARYMFGANDGIEALAALAGLFAGLAWTRHRSQNTQQAEAVVLRRLPEPFSISIEHTNS